MALKDSEQVGNLKLEQVVALERRGADERLPLNHFHIHLKRGDRVVAGGLQGPIGAGDWEKPGIIKRPFGPAQVDRRALTFTFPGTLVAACQVEKGLQRLVQVQRRPPVGVSRFARNQPRCPVDDALLVGRHGGRVLFATDGCCPETQNCQGHLLRCGHPYRLLPSCCPCSILSAFPPNTGVYAPIEYRFCALARPFAGAGAERRTPPYVAAACC
ncbi:MAG: hypothetical protein HC884_15155 [Chloroflexaceae bacterium]|nr:hypothetical protein [Chloroflexaceae bacterium]